MAIRVGVNILQSCPVKHAIPKWCTGRKWHIPMASNRKKSRRRIWLTKWDKVKAHDTLIDWCTGRERPLNCMTVISARWQSNMSSQRLRKWYISDGKLWRDIEWAIELLYNSVRTGSQWVGEQTSWSKRCGKESHHPVEGAFGIPIELETRWWQDAVEEAHTQQRGLPGLQLSSPGERERHNADGHKSGGSIYCSLCSVSNSLSHANLAIKWEVYFLKKSSLVFIYFICVYKPIYYVSIQHSILVTDYLAKIGIKIVPQPPYCPDLAPCDFW